MVVPSGHFGDLLVTDWADAVLLFPKPNELSASAQGGHHLDAKAPFKVDLPRAVIGVGPPVDFDVAFNWDRCGRAQPFGLPLVRARKHPVVVAVGREVFLLHPSTGFSWVASLHPAPERAGDRVIYGAKDDFADDMPVEGSPSLNERVEQVDQASGIKGIVRLNDPSDLGKEGFYIVLGWGDQ
jgi:hypothetical protein